MTASAISALPILLSWSGGKDAAWALHALRRRDDVRVVGLVTTVTEGYERVAMQGIRREVLHAQARAVGLDVVEARLPQRADNATYERVFAQALDEARARWSGLRDIAFGDLFLADIKAYRDVLCARLGWTPHYPIFDPALDASGTGAVARAMLAAGLRAHLTCVDTQQLDAVFSGRAFDDALLTALPAHTDPCGERGEFHTLATDGPMFTAPLHVRRGESVLREGRFAYTDFVLD